MDRRTGDVCQIASSIGREGVMRGVWWQVVAGVLRYSRSKAVADCGPASRRIWTAHAVFRIPVLDEGAADAAVAVGTDGVARERG